MVVKNAICLFGISILSTLTWILSKTLTRIPKGLLKFYPVTEFKALTTLVCKMVSYYCWLWRCHCLLGPLDQTVFCDHHREIMLSSLSKAGTNWYSENSLKTHRKTYVVEQNFGKAASYRPKACHLL